MGDTPVPIPNTTVKTQSADGTALETVWESRWAPDQKENNRPEAYCIQFLRKEVIQPHLPIRLPCYDFTPVIGPAFGSSSLAVGH